MREADPAVISAESQKENAEKDNYKRTSEVMDDQSIVCGLEVKTESVCLHQSFSGFGREAL